MQAKKKFGISLIVLIITIIVTLIIVSAVVFSIGNNIKEANLSKFTNQISQLEDALNSYYISTNALPQSEEMSKDEVKEVVENYNVFEKELELNGDSSSNLYKLDISQMDIEGDTSKLNNLIYSYPNFNVYDLNGFKQDDNIYYSITSRINDKIVEINNSDSNSSIGISEGATLKMTNDTSTNTNKLGININATLKPEHILELYFSNITSGKKVKRSDDGYINIVFNNLEQLNESLENTISEDEIDKFNSSTEKIVKAVIKDTNNSNIIAEEICNVSNYDPIAPNFSFVSDAMYDNMKVLRFKVFDNSSGVKEVRYDYLQKFDTNSNVQNYYSSLESFDNQYMEKKAKVLEANDIVDNQIELKIPKEVATVCAIAIDNAGNTSGIETVTYTKNVLCRITIDKTNPTSSNEILYTFKFNKDVQGFEKDDINVTNGIKGTFSKVSSSEYTLLVTDGASGVQIVEVPSDVCTDGNGNQNTGATYKLNIDKISPTISNIIVASPVDGKYKAGQKVDIKVAYDKNIYANSNKSKVTSSNAPKLKIRFGNGSERETSFSSVSEKEIMYSYTIQSGDNGLLTSSSYNGKVYDSLGNELILSSMKIGGYKIEADTTPPVLNNIKVTSPSSGTYASGQTVTIVAEYSENVYGSGKATLTSSTAPVLKIKFGTGTERITNFSSVSSNKITYTYTISSTDEGVLATTSYSGSVYDELGNVTQVSNKTLTGNNITALTGAINKTTQKYYIKLQDAIDQSSNGNEIQLLSSKAVDKNINIGSNKNIVLDLNNISITNSTLSTDNEEYIITSSGTTVLKNAKLSGGLLIKNNGNLTLSNSQLSTDEYEAIENSSGSLALVDGVNIDCIMATAIRNNSGATLTLGINDDNISTETPKITARLPIVNNGTFNFYDGKLFYENNIAISGIVSTTPTNYDVIYYTENGKKVASLGIAVVKNITKNIGYLDLPTAVNSATDGDIIKMLEDITLSETLDIDKDITLDFNASILSSSITDYVINNTKNLTLTNSASGGSGITGKYGIINSGTIDIRVSINADSWHGILNTGTVNLNGGSITGATSGIYSNASSATTNIISGDVESTSGNGVYLKFGTLNIGNNTDSTVSTTSPTISGKNYGVYKEAGTFNFYDGVISGESSAIYGTVNSTPTNYSVIYSNYNKTAKLGKNTEIVATNTTLNKNYDNLQVAIDSASSGNALKILKNIQLSESLKVAATRNSSKDLNTLAIDTNSFEISSSSTYALENSIALTISGTGKIASTSNTAIYHTSKELTLSECQVSSDTKYGVEIHATSAEAATTIVNIKNNASVSGTTGIYVYYGGINLVSGTVTGSTSYGINLTSGSNNKLTMSGGIVKSISGSYALYMSSSTRAVITSGNIQADSGSGIYVENSTNNQLTLGTNDNTISQLPKVTGSKYGVYSSGTNSVFNFYDGIITGSNSGAIQGVNVDSKPSGYEVIYSKNNTIASLDASYNVVATNTTLNKNYGDIQVAIDSASSGNTIQLKKSFTYSTQISIPSGKTINLNSNGYTITSNSTSSYVISNAGTLTISGTGKIVSTGYSVVNNTGTLNLNSTATIEGPSTAAKYGILNTAGTINIAGGTVTSGDGIRLVSGTLAMSSGLVNSKADDAIEYVNGKITLTGGKVTGKYGIWKSGTTTAEDVLTLGTDDSTVSTTSPEITTTSGATNFPATGTFNFYDGVITGGATLSLNVDNLPTKASGTYNVVYSNSNKTAKLSNSAVVTNTSLNKNYEDIQVAVDSASSGNTLKLLKSISKSTTNQLVEIKSDDNIILDTNGFTLENTNSTSTATSSSSTVYTILNSGTLKITGNGKITGSTYYPIKNDSTLTFETATITGKHAVKNSGDFVMNSGSMQNTETRGIVSNYGNFTIKGGEIKAYCQGIENNSSGSTISIEGGTIEGAAYIIDLTYGTCDMSGGTIQLTKAWTEEYGGECVCINNGLNNSVTFNMSGGIINNSFKPTFEYESAYDATWNSGIWIWNNSNCYVNITGGEINVPYGNGIFRYYVDDSEITLGKNDSSISSSSPTITAGIYGVLLRESENCSFNFYDGIISGGKETIVANVSDTPSGYKVGYFANGTSAKLIPNSVTAINETTGTTYTSLVTAISNALAGNTVSMQSDTSVSSAISITKALNLNMNKYTLSSTSTSAYVLNNSSSGDLTIKSMNNSGKILSSGYRAIYNGGHMVIDNCNVETTASNYAIYNNSSSSKKLEIQNNSNITGGTEGVYMYTGILDLNSGTITGNSSYGVDLTSGTTLNMNGGTIKTNGTSESISALGVTSATTNVKKGNIISENGRGVYITNNSSSKLNIGDSSIELDNSTPIITGGTYGIYSAGSSSIISLYNGVIKGKTAAINSESYIDNKRSGYNLDNYTSGDYKYLRLTK